MTIRHLGPETIRRLQLVADDRGVSKAQAARLILQNYLLDLPPRVSIGTHLYEISRPGFELQLPTRTVGELRDPFADWDDRE